MNKFFAKPTTIDNIRFASLREADRYQELKLLQWAGNIRDLQLQVPFRLVVNNQLITTYVADFVYSDKYGARHVEDSKGYVTRIYKLKKKLMLACHGITIEES